MKRIVLWLVAIGAVCALFAVWYGEGPEPSAPASNPVGERSPGRKSSPIRPPPGEEEKPALSSAKPPPGKAGATRRESPPSLESRLAALKKSMPPGKPAEWSLCRPLYEGRFTWTPDAVREAIRYVLLDHMTMDVPPYYVHHVFGDSDEEWLQSVRKNCHEAYVQAFRDAGVDEKGRENDEEIRLIEDRVHRPFAELLKDEAARRVAAVPELSRMFRDTRRVCDMPPGSKERQRAQALVEDIVQLGSYWKDDPVYRITKEDMKYLSVADLAQVARWIRERREAVIKHNVTRKQKDEYIRVVRPSLIKLFQLIQQRAGE